jgi:hypothetical protein
MKSARGRYREWFSLIAIPSWILICKEGTFLVKNLLEGSGFKYLFWFCASDFDKASILLLDGRENL